VAELVPDGSFDPITGGERYVVLLAQRTPERLRPLVEVRAQIETTVVNANRAALRDAFLAEVREVVPVETLLPDPFGGMFDFSQDAGAGDAPEGQGEDAPANTD